MNINNEVIIDGKNIINEKKNDSLNVLSLFLIIIKITKKGANITTCSHTKHKKGKIKKILIIKLKT